MDAWCKTDFKRAAEHIFAVLVGTYFVLSAFGKFLDVWQFVRTVEQYGVPSSAAQVAILLPPLEIVAGIFLVFPATRKISSVIIVVLLIVFTSAYMYAHFSRGVQECGCSGKIYSLNKNFPELIGFNSILFALSIFVCLMSKNRWTNLDRRRKALFFSSALSLLVVTTAIAEISFLREKTQKLDANTLSSPFRGIFSGDIDSTYALFFYDMGCPHCVASLWKVNELQRKKVVDRVFGYTFGTDSDLVHFERNFHLNFTSRLLPVERFFTLVDSVPSIFFIKDGKVVYADKGNVKEPLWYMQYMKK
jgi:uncharacterized membrane protein YphA (DoxX/SURF4 family)